jgi:hypothetical protein
MWPPIYYIYIYIYESNQLDHADITRLGEE